MLPAGVVTDLKKALESVQVRADGATVEGAIHMSSTTLLGVPFWFLLAEGPAAPATPALPPKVLIK